MVNDVPKPLAPVHGRPFIEFQLDYLQSQGVKRVVLAVGYQWNMIQEHLGDTYNGLDLTYSVEQQPLGTGGGLLLAIKTLGSAWHTRDEISSDRKEHSILVLNGDTWFPVSLSALLSFHHAKCSVATVGVSQQQNTQRYAAIELSPNGRIQRFSAGMKHMHNHDIFINGGVYIIANRLLSKWEEKTGQKMSLEQDMLENIVMENNCYGFVSNAAFLDIGVPDAYDQAQQMFFDTECSSML